MRLLIRCPSCRKLVPAYKNRIFCSALCKVRRAPVVYRFVCPDGRSYVAAAGDISNRNDKGIQRSNRRLEAAFKQYPPETWTFENSRAAAYRLHRDREEEPSNVT